MSQVHDIQEFRRRRAVKRAAPLWAERFPEPFQEDLYMADLSDQTLYTFALLGDTGTAALYELIMAIMDLGPVARFHDLEGAEKMAVLDAGLFLTDQIRFEILHRLNLAHGHAAEKHPIMDLILDHERIKREFQPPFPELDESHAQRPEFERRRCIDGEAMIRSLIPAALTAFARRL